VATFTSSADHLWLSHVGDDLVLSSIGTDNQVTFSNWFSLGEQHVRITDTNGSTLSFDAVDQLVTAMAGFTAPSAGVTSLPSSYSSLNPIIASSWVASSS